MLYSASDFVFFWLYSAIDFLFSCYIGPSILFFFGGRCQLFFGSSGVPSARLPRTVPERSISAFTDRWWKRHSPCQLL